MGYGLVTSIMYIFFYLYSIINKIMIKKIIYILKIYIYIANYTTIDIFFKLHLTIILIMVEFLM